MQRSAECIPRCQCLTKKGTQCTRAAARDATTYRRYCSTHARCREREEKKVDALLKYAEATLKELQSLR